MINKKVRFTKVLPKIMILLISITVFSLPAFAEKGMNLTIDDELVDLKNPLFIEKDKTFISLVDLSEKLGVEIDNLKGDKSFIVRKYDNSIQFNVSEKIANLNGKNIILDVPSKIVNKNIYLPMRTTLEGLSYGVVWDSKNKTTKIYSVDEENIEVPIKSSPKVDVLPAKYVAHAGGRMKGLNYTNSKEAIENSYKNGHSMIEIDMEWSTDGHLLLVHDWGNFSKFVNSNDVKPYNVEEFKNLKMVDDLTTMTIDDLADWLEANHGVYVVTDIKVNNLRALRTIKDKYPELIDRFIPQIYNFEEYNQVKNMGYKDIIITMYMSNYTDAEMLEFVKKNKVFAVTMPVSRAKTNLPSLLMTQNVFTYTHTVNTDHEVKELQKYSIKGFYTDDLIPEY